MQETNEGHVTTIVSRRIKVGREADFEEWLASITNAAHQFPGYLGANVLRPTSKNQPEFVTIFRFDSYANLAQWENSEQRQNLLKQSEELAEGEMQVQKISGLDFWFTPPTAQAPIAPPRYKMAIVLTCVIFILSLVLAPVLAKLLMILPPLLRQFAIVALQVTLITYFILPFLTRSLSRWLFASSRANGITNKNRK